MTTRQVLVLGGTGFVGRAVCAQLAARQVRIRILSRDAAKARPLTVLPALEALHGSPHDDATLRRAMAGVDAVINLVGILHERGRDTFERAHVDLPRRVAQLCREANVTRLVHMSALKADPEGPSAYLRSRGRGEAAARAAFGQSGLTILRPSVIFGAGDRFVNLFAAMAQWAPVIPLAGAHARFQPVWVEDVARALVDCLEDERTRGQAYELCGPDVTTLAEIVLFAARTRGLRRRVIPLPGPVAALQALVMEKLPGPLMTRDNLRSMSIDNVCECGWPGVFAFAPSAMQSVVPSYLSPGVPRDRYAGRRDPSLRASRRPR